MKPLFNNFKIDSNFDELENVLGISKSSLDLLIGNTNLNPNTMINLSNQKMDLVNPGVKSKIQERLNPDIIGLNQKLKGLI